MILNKNGNKCGTALIDPAWPQHGEYGTVCTGCKFIQAVLVVSSAEIFYFRHHAVNNELTDFVAICQAAHAIGNDRKHPAGDRLKPKTVLLTGTCPDVVQCTDPRSLGRFRSGFHLGLFQNHRLGNSGGLDLLRRSIFCHRRGFGCKQFFHKFQKCSTKDNTDQANKKKIRQLMLLFWGLHNRRCARDLYGSCPVNFLPQIIFCRSDHLFEHFRRGFGCSADRIPIRIFALQLGFKLFRHRICRFLRCLFVFALQQDRNIRYAGFVLGDRQIQRFGIFAACFKIPLRIGWFFLTGYCRGGNTTGSRFGRGGSAFAAAVSRRHGIADRILGTGCFFKITHPS